MTTGFPVRISVRVDFSDGTVHEHEISNLAALPASPNEMRAGIGLPPADGPSWTPHETMLAQLYGTCGSCGGPRNVRTIPDGPVSSRSAYIYCPVCG